MSSPNLSSFTCQHCQLSLPSRNKLFQHLRSSHTSNSSSSGEVVSSASATSVQVKASPSSSPPHIHKNGTMEEEKKHNSTQIGEKKTLPDHYVYVLGGRLRGRTLNAVWRYSTLRGIWEDCPAGRMRENRGSHGAVTVNNTIYVVGGGGLHSNLFSCEKFDGKQWQCISAMNVSRHALAVTSWEDWLVASGGWIDGSKCSGAVEAYHCDGDDANKWFNLPDLTIPRKLHGCAALGGKLYVFGGSCDEPMWHTNTIEVIDLLSVMKELKNETEFQATKKMKGDNASKSVVDESGYIVQTKEARRSGGEGEGEADLRRSIISDSYQKYSGCSGWRVLETVLPTVRGGVSAITIGDVIYLFLHGKGVYSFDPESETITELSELPVPDWHCFDVTSADKMKSKDTIASDEVYVIGGASNGAWSKLAFVYNTRQNNWHQLPSMPQAKRRMACTVFMDT